MALFRPGLPFLRGVIEAVLNRQDVPIETPHVPATASKVVAEVVAAIEAAPDVAVVATRPAAQSKINRTQLAGLAATGLAWVGLDLSAEQLLAVFAGIQAVQSILTIVWRTWFTKTVTPQSAGRP